MNRTQWAERLPIIKAFLEGKTIQGFSRIKNDWCDIDPNGDFDFDKPSDWRLKPGQNEQNIDILFQNVRDMKDQIGELQLQVQKLETGKRDDQPDDDEELEKLRAFKARVHTQLDAFGVPTFGQVECRVSARLNWLQLEVKGWKDKWEASARESKALAAQRDQNAALNHDVDERVRQEVQLATDVLRREYAASSKETIDLIAQIRCSYAQEFEEDSGPINDLVRHTFVTLATERVKVRKFKILLGRWLVMNNGNPVNPNDRRDLINETRESL